MNWLNYHHLYYFLKIAENGSISKASEVLRLGQPTLSVQLSLLEDQLGELFERRNRRLVLTERGQLVLRYAKEIFSKGDELLRSVNSGELAEQPVIFIGAQEGVPKAIIAATIQRLLKVTKAKIVLREGDPAELMESVLKGQLDLLLTDHEFTSPTTLQYLPVAREALAIWRSVDIAPLEGKFPANIDGQAFVMPSAGHPLCSQLEKFFIENGVSPSTVCEIPDTALVKELGVKGVGLIALGETTVRSWVRAKRLELVGRTKIIQKYWLGIPKRSLSVSYLEHLTKEFRER
jgi:LysR family transcriptional activator of nhaA